MTEHKNSSDRPDPAPATSAKAIEQIQADRQRLGLTPAMLEERRLESLRRPF